MNLVLQGASAKAKGSDHHGHHAVHGMSAAHKHHDHGAVPDEPPASAGPAAALRPAAAAISNVGEAAAASATIYTCPMHPEIRQDRPGNCPKCGMTLEPLIPEATADDDNPELRDFSRRFWWTLPLTVVVTVLAMGGH